MNINGDVSLLNVSSGGCKYSISPPVIGQKWEIIMKHEGRIILYSCDNISLFYKHTQIFISIENPFNTVSCYVKKKKKKEVRERLVRGKKANVKRWFLTIESNVGYGGRIRPWFLLLVIKSWQQLLILWFLPLALRCVYRSIKTVPSGCRILRSWLKTGNCDA